MRKSILKAEEGDEKDKMNKENLFFFSSFYLSFLFPSFHSFFASLFLFFSILSVSLSTWLFFPFSCLSSFLFFFLYLFTFFFSFLFLFLFLFSSFLFPFPTFFQQTAKLLKRRGKGKKKTRFFMAFN